MTVAEKYIIETYSSLFKSLNESSRTKLLRKLSVSLKTKNNKTEDDFFKSFGAFASDKSAEDINRELKESRKFNRSDIKL